MKLAASDFAHKVGIRERSRLLFLTQFILKAF